MVVVQALLESMSRCFGSECANGESSSSRGSKLTQADKENGAEKESGAASVSGSVRSKVLKGLELKNEEFDALFEKDGSPLKVEKKEKAMKEESANVETEINIADVVANARRAAHPAHHRTPTQAFQTQASAKDKQEKSKKRAAKRKADIFRMRPGDDLYDPHRHGTNIRNRAKSPPGSPSIFSSKFLTQNKAFAQVLCFANPIHDSHQEDETKLPAKTDNDNEDDAHTLNTAEDTITSTLYYDAKFSHVVESRPPMPLFPHFQVPCEEKHQNNELTKIVSTGSHRSFKLWEVIHPDTSNRNTPSRNNSKNASANKTAHLNHNHNHDHQQQQQQQRSPMIIVDPQVKHHPKQPSPSINSNSKINFKSQPRLPAKSQTNQTNQTHIPQFSITISSSGSQEDTNHKNNTDNISSSQQSSPSTRKQLVAAAAAAPQSMVKLLSNTATTANTTQNTISDSDSSSASSSSSSCSRHDIASSRLQTQLRPRNQLTVISTPPKYNSPASSPSASPKVVTPNSAHHHPQQQPHYHMTMDDHHTTNALPNMLKLKNSSNSTSASTPTCSTSDSIGFDRHDRNNGLSSSAHSLPSIRQAPPAKILDANATAALTHNVL